MKQPLFTGVCTALVTPFLDDRINYPLLQQLIVRQIRAGIPAIVLSGTTGEAATLTDIEKSLVLQRGLEAAGGRCKVIAGTGSSSTAHAVALSQEAEALGADALLVISPYCNKANSGGLISHYQAVAQAVSIPVIIYNVPSRTGLDIPVAVYGVLSHVPNIIGVKEANPDIARLTEIRRVCGPGFTIWSGCDELATAAMAVGAKGIISVVSNLVPAQMLELSGAALDGDFDTAAGLQAQLQPLIRQLFCEVNPIPVKAAMKLLGFDCGACRLPLGNLGSSHRKRLEELLA